MIPTVDLCWSKSCRLVPSRYPPESLFDRVADATDFDALNALESLTNERLREEVGQIGLVAEEDRVFGPGTTPIMAAFTHPNPDGSRFSRGYYGVYYAGNNIETAKAEVAYHLGEFYRATSSPKATETLRVYYAQVKGVFHDIRNMQSTMPELYDPKSYVASQVLGNELWEKKSNGICYNSVRNHGGQCLAIFRPPVIEPVVQGPHVQCHWNGATITSFSKIERL